MSKITFTGGRENTVEVELVESNYHSKEPNEQLLQFSGPVSIQTLEEILNWARAELTLEGKEQIIFL